MKNVEAFRDDAKLDEMTINELTFYSKIIPYYEKFLKTSGSDLETKWAPKFYYGFYGFDKGHFLLL
jgi:Ecdysteroid kinase-like family